MDILLLGENLSYDFDMENRIVSVKWLQVEVPQVWALIARFAKIFEAELKSSAFLLRDSAVSIVIISFEPNCNL